MYFANISSYPSVESSVWNSWFNIDRESNGFNMLVVTVFREYGVRRERYSIPQNKNLTGTDWYTGLKAISVPGCTIISVPLSAAKLFYIFVTDVVTSA